MNIHAITGHDIAFLFHNSYAHYDDGLINAERIRKTMHFCKQHDLKGIMTFGELSEPTNLINYLAAGFFQDNPEAKITEFLEYAVHKLSTIGG